MINERELILEQMARFYFRAVRKCSLLLTIPNTGLRQGRVRISFHVDIENEILCHEPGISAFIFSC